MSEIFLIFVAPSVPENSKAASQCHRKRCPLKVEVEKSFSSSDDEGVSLSVVLQLRGGKDGIIPSNQASWCDQPPISRGLMENKTGKQPQQQPWFEHSRYGSEEEEEEQGRRTWSWKAKRGTWGEARNNTQSRILRGSKLTFWCSCFLFKETTKKKSITQILHWICGICVSACVSMKNPLKVL